MPKASHNAFSLVLFLLQLPSGSMEEGAAMQQNNFNTPLSCFHCCITCAHLPSYTQTEIQTILCCRRCQTYTFGNKCNVIQSKGARASAQSPISLCDISIRRYYPSHLTGNSSALVVWQRLFACVICTFQPELAKVSSPVSVQSWSKPGLFCL